MKNYEYEKDIPFWKRREYWISPLFLFLIIGFIFYGFFYSVYWLLKWILFSSIGVFSDSEFFCNKGFHKYRIYYSNRYYKCKICKKEMIKYIGGYD